MNKKRSMTGLYIILAVLFIGIGYAAVSNVTLTITGNAKVTPGNSSFNVHFLYDSNTASNNIITGTPGGGYTATAATEAKYTGNTNELVLFPYIFVYEDSPEYEMLVREKDLLKSKIIKL